MHLGEVPEIGNGITAAEAGHAAVTIGLLAGGLWLAYKGVTMVATGSNTFSKNSTSNTL